MFSKCHKFWCSRFPAVSSAVLRFRISVSENRRWWRIIGIEPALARLSWSWSVLTALMRATALGVHLNGEREWCLLQQRCSETTRGFNELCSFTARLMRTSGDPSHFLCECVWLFHPRGSDTLQQHNGYLWDLIPGTSEALLVCCHNFTSSSFFMQMSLLLQFFQQRALFDCTIFTGNYKLNYIKASGATF